MLFIAFRMRNLLERLAIGATVLPFGAAVGRLAFDDGALSAYGTGLANQGIWYAEIRFASQQHCKEGLSQKEAL